MIAPDFRGTEPIAVTKSFATFVKYNYGKQSES